MNRLHARRVRSPRWLVLHADDFGMNAAVTHGVADGFSHGLLTSASLLVNAPAAELAVGLWKRLEQSRRASALPSSRLRSAVADPAAPFDLGVHLNLTQGRPLIGHRYPAELLDAEGRFAPPAKLFLKLLIGGQRWRAPIEDELSAQIAWLFDRGLRPTHLNGHQYIETMPIVAGVVVALAKRHAIATVRAACEPGHWRSSLRPGMRLANGCLSCVKRRYALRCRRRLAAAGLDYPDAYFGASHAGRIDLALMGRFLRLAERHVRTEIALHPGRAALDLPCDSDGWADSLAEHRPAELQLLCSPELAGRMASRGFRLARLHRPAGRSSLAA